ncbi:Transcriptional regulatory protein AfsQ1 [compost metagenome]
MADYLTVLVAEDNAADRLLLSTIVSRQGHRVVTASNGLEALAQFAQERPQLVLMDVMMPVMDGFEVARRIRQRTGEELVPIIFLTSLTETGELGKGLEAGGDDFLIKPYNRVVIEAKIRAMARLHHLQRMVMEQRDLIARHNEHLLNEQRVAKAVFDKVAHSGCLNAANIRYLQSPFAVFNGDLLLAAFKPSGGMHVLLGDFTGHGLPAAIGAMPLAEVFYGMTAKGYSMPDILREMNAKLKRILPVGVFCCASMLNLSFQRGLVEVWTGGLPDGFLYRRESRELVPLVSRHLPLGILAPADFDERYEVYAMSEGDRVFLFSDGVLEATNTAGEMFGEKRLREVFASQADASRLFDDIQTTLSRFRGEAQDDLSMLEVALVPQISRQRPPLAFSDSGLSNPLDWSASFEFRAPTLKHFNPLPFLLQLLMEVQALRPKGGALYSVLAELYSNALEHGVMGLDSSLKRDAKGFARYYEQRAKRLAALRDGYVRFHLDLSSHVDGGGRLLIRMEDSGDGFDIGAVLQSQGEVSPYCGRGLMLVRQLADRCQWSSDGKSVSVEFFWEG